MKSRATRAISAAKALHHGDLSTLTVPARSRDRTRAPPGLHHWESARGAHENAILVTTLGTLEPPDSRARVVVEVGWGVLVYPPEADGGPWWATFTENGRRRFCQGATEAKLAAKLEKVTERLSAGAGNAERSGGELIAHYLDPGRLPVERHGPRRSRGSLSAVGLHCAVLPGAATRGRGTLVLLLC